MSNFTVRIELLGADASDYATLDKKMSEAGFLRNVGGNDNSGKKGVWELPTGEYDYSSETMKAQTVRDRAKEIATEVSTNAWVLVTEASSRSWSTRRIRSSG